MTNKLDFFNENFSSPLSTTVFTFSALISKPAISLAPMIIVAVLNPHGYSEYRNSLNSTLIMQNTNFTTTTLSSTNFPPVYNSLFDTMFHVLLIFPLVCAVIEFLCFAPYRLKFRHKTKLIVK